MSNARKLAANLPTEGSLSGRNVIINGNFEIAQRGTSQTAAGYGTLDRFVMSLSGATATMTQESFTIGQTDVVGSHKFLKLAVSTGNNNSGVYYKVEAQDAIPFVGKKVTLTYYAKGTSPAGGLQVAIGWYDGSNSSSYASTTVTLTSTWTKYTHTFDVPSINGITLTNVNAYLEVKWAQADTDTGTGAYEVNLAQVQLEAGPQSTPFEHEPYDTTLEKCQRYYQISGTGRTYGIVFNQFTATNAYANQRWWKLMRTAPTITMNSLSNYSVYNTGGAKSKSAVGIGQLSDNSGEFYITTESLGQGTASHLNTNGDAFCWKADAEL